MRKAILFAPSREAIDASLDARRYANRLSRRLELAVRPYEVNEGSLAWDDVDSLSVLAGLSALELESGYMEMELDTVFKPQELLGKLRGVLSADFPVVAIVDDAYSDYLMSVYLKAGASAVVGTSGDLFGLVTSRFKSLDQLFPYINSFPRV